jgi:hypothetical protein
MRKIFPVLFFVILALPVFAEDQNTKVIYKYKQYEKFDFAEMDIGAGTEGPGDISVIQRMQSRFVNKLPYRRNFNPEIKKSVGRVR